METRWRSAAKAFSWRFIATFITAGIVLALTHEGKFALTVGLMDTTVKLLIYFFHERIWLKVPFGKIKRADFEI